MCSKSHSDQRCGLRVGTPSKLSSSANILLFVHRTIHAGMQKHILNSELLSHCLVLPWSGLPIRSVMLLSCWWVFPIVGVVLPWHWSGLPMRSVVLPSSWCVFPIIGVVLPSHCAVLPWCVSFLLTVSFVVRIGGYSRRGRAPSHTVCRCLRCWFPATSRTPMFMPTLPHFNVSFI